MYSLVTTIFDTAAITHNCARFHKLLSIGFVMALPSTSMLFFLRVRAVYNQNPFIMVFFGVLWTTVLLSSMTPLFGTSGANIGPTKYCVVSRLEPYVASAAIAPLVFDTLVFAAITWRLMGNAHIRCNLKTGLKTLMFGDCLPAFSRAFLQDGQAYYLKAKSETHTRTITIFTSLTSVIMLYVPNVPPAYRVMFATSNVSVMNIMACRVFRNTKFGIYREADISTSRIMATREQDIGRSPLVFQKSNVAVDTLKGPRQSWEQTYTHNLRFQVPETSTSPFAHVDYNK
ncbi:hypothetical protein CVT24_003030 [Panaeolus cyanescens]|uniref:Uncharacterized protein n=1 Tax=Panaeolus cyanescens TaxID=181874 RepID=A0A409VFP8_9AGAR|nr:hypothetical protein CVT24_003030 [Panaeolus cyanescens]